MDTYKIMLYCPSYIRLNKIQFTAPPYVEELNKIVFSKSINSLMLDL